MTHIYYNTETFQAQDMRPIYLVVADESEEFDSALRYAARAARSANAHVGVLYVIPEPGFMDWGGVEERMRTEQREEAEMFLREVSARVYDIGRQTAVLFLQAGDKVEAILKVMQANPTISKLILGGDADAGNPGPLVKYFSGKGMRRLPVPLTIIPDHIPPEKIDSFV